MRPSRITALFLSVCLAGGAWAEARFVTPAGGAQLVDGPWVESRAVGALPQGAKVTVTERYQGYALVRTATGFRAWVAGGSLGATPVAPQPKPSASAQPGPKAPVATAAAEVRPYSSVVWTKSGPLNMRKGPGTNHAVTGQCQRGDWVKVIAKAGSWAQVTLADGKEGWVHSAYLTR